MDVCSYAVFQYSLQANTNSDNQLSLSLSLFLTSLSKKGRSPAQYIFIPPPPTCPMSSPKPTIHPLHPIRLPQAPKHPHPNVDTQRTDRPLTRATTCNLTRSGRKAEQLTSNSAKSQSSRTKGVYCTDSVLSEGRQPIGAYVCGLELNRGGQAQHAGESISIYFREGLARGV